MPPEPSSSLFVVVFSCGGLGAEVANRLAETPGVRRVALVTTPYRQQQRTLLQQIRHTWRMQGPWMVAVRALARLFPGFAKKPDETGPALRRGLREGIEHAHFSDLHDADCLSYLRGLGPDLGVLAGTYIVREDVFELPRLGSINLHSGKTPEYRGAAPAFWELYNGAREVGITIHRVVAAVDAGEVLLQETFPLDPAPAGDPMDYLDEYRKKVLRPHGIRLLAQAVEQIASARDRAQLQDESKARTYRTPDYAAIRDLRRRVAARRRSGSA